jgi:hypothetical protein
VIAETKKREEKRIRFILLEFCVIALLYPEHQIYEYFTIFQNKEFNGIKEN